MKCPKYHSEFPSDTRFCSKCGVAPPYEEISVSHTKTLEKPTEELARGSTLAKRYEVIEDLEKRV